MSGERVIRQPGWLVGHSARQRGWQVVGKRTVAPEARSVNRCSTDVWPVLARLYDTVQLKQAGKSVARRTLYSLNCGGKPDVISTRRLFVQIVRVSRARQLPVCVAISKLLSAATQESAAADEIWPASLKRRQEGSWCCQNQHLLLTVALTVPFGALILVRSWDNSKALLRETRPKVSWPS